MTRYVLGRMGQAALVLWAAYTLTYAILYLLPGDPLSIMLNAQGLDPGSLTLEQQEAAEASYGLDRSFPEQYSSSLWAAVQGDLGTSLTRGVPVTELLGERMRPTLVLAVSAVLLAITGGCMLAYTAASAPEGIIRRVLSRMPALAFSAPTFWVGLLLIQIFSFTLGWFPSTGSEGWQAVILPAVTLSIPSAAVFAQVLYKSFVTEQRQAYVTTASAKGLRRSQIQRCHVLRNAVLPLTTLIGLQVGNTVSGAVIVETVFARHGIGRLSHEAVLAQDIPVVLGIVTVSAAAFVVVNLLVDLAYPFLDPRIAHTPKVST